jgi:prolyl oligopeptidase
MIRTMIRFFVFPLALAMTASAFSAGQDLKEVNTTSGPPPASEKRPVTDVYHGVKVLDDYRWLEDFSDPAVKQWAARQNSYARQYLDQLPGRQQIREQYQSLYSAAFARYSELSYAGGTLFAVKFQPPKNQPMLVALKSADDLASERVVVDPNQIDASGGTSIDFYVPSLDGRFLAVSMSKGGSESGTLYVYDAASGKQLGEIIPRVNGGTAGGSVAWNHDGSGFYYTRYPSESERPAADLDFFQQIWFHKLGSPVTEDSYSLGKDFPRIAEIRLETSRDGRYILAEVLNGDGGEREHFVMGPDGKWKQITRFSDQARNAVLGRDGALYLLSIQNAPRGKVLRLPLATPSLVAAKEIIPQSDVPIESFVPTQTRLYVVEIAGGPSRLRLFNLQGRPQGEINLLPVSSVGQLAPLEGDQVLFENQSYLEPPAWFAYDPAGGSSHKTAMFMRSPADFSNVEVLREFATSKDGTKVPVNIILRKGTQRDGKNPVLLTGYGGYSISLVPRFDRTLRIWLDRGFIMAIANLRGGGEFGDSWHRQGNLANKQNVFDDFIACAEHLIHRGYTSPAHLAIQGGSNGGLLMGAVLTERPELFGAVVSHVGIYDMLRVELDPNGAFNVTEFGTVKDPALFHALYDYSPYHHVRDGTRYPPILFLTGDNDPRVNPAHSRKMIARLQAANAAQTPVLLRTSSNSGHGIGTSLNEAIEQNVDVAAFILRALQLN